MAWKKRILIFSVIFYLTQFADAQCDLVEVENVCSELYVGLHGSPTTCYVADNCEGLLPGYFVVSMDDTTVIDALDQCMFYAGNYSNCIATFPFCYDILTVRAIIDLSINQVGCCDFIESQFPGFCDSINANFTQVPYIEDLNDMLIFMRSLSMGNLKLDSLVTALGDLNELITNSPPVCFESAIGFCMDPVDFTNPNIKLFQIDPDICLIEDCTDSVDLQPAFFSAYPHQPIIRVNEYIGAEGNLTTDHTFTSGHEISLKPDFSIDGGVVFEATIGDCLELKCNNPERSVQDRLDCGEAPCDLISDGIIPLDSLYGKMYEGGLIFYFDTMTCSGLVTSSYMIFVGEFGCSGDIPGLPNVDDPESDEGAQIGDGQSNTDSIIAEPCTHANEDIAAFICNTLTLNGYNDWFLPSVLELNAIYFQLYYDGPLSLDDLLKPACTDAFWSSSEYDPMVTNPAAWHHGWVIYFDGLDRTGGLFNGDIEDRGRDLNVLPVRSFGSE